MIAVDVWSAGVILLFFLSKKFPIFQSNDDIEGLMEITAIIGKRKIERAATLHGKSYISLSHPDIHKFFLTARSNDSDERPRPRSRWDIMARVRRASESRHMEAPEIRHEVLPA